MPSTIETYTVGKTLSNENLYKPTFNVVFNVDCGDNVNIFCVGKPIFRGKIGNNITCFVHNEEGIVDSVEKIGADGNFLPKNNRTSQYLSPKASVGCYGQFGSPSNKQQASASTKKEEGTTTCHLFYFVSR